MLSINVSIYLYLSIYLSNLSIHPSIYPSIYPFIYPSIYYLSFYVFIHPSIYPSLSLYLSIYPSIYLSIYLSIHPSIHPYMNLFIDLSFLLYQACLTNQSFQVLRRPSIKTPSLKWLLMAVYVLFCFTALCREAIKTHSHLSSSSWPSFTSSDWHGISHTHLSQESRVIRHSPSHSCDPGWPPPSGTHSALWNDLYAVTWSPSQLSI
jgi:hypothetical protein